MVLIGFYGVATAAGDASNQIPVLNGVPASGPHLAVMTRCLFGNEGLREGREGHGEEDRRTEGGVGGGGERGVGLFRRDLLELASNVTPPGNKQGLLQNSFFFLGEVTEGKKTK